MKYTTKDSIATTTRKTKVHLGSTIKAITIAQNTIRFPLRNTVEEAFIDYKTAKEKYIKERALFYLNNGGIKRNVYEALININIAPYNSYK